MSARAFLFHSERARPGGTIFRAQHPKNTRKMKPSVWLLFAAVVSLGISVYFWNSGNLQLATFIGLWVPSILSLATYFKVR